MLADGIPAGSGTLAETGASWAAEVRRGIMEKEYEAGANRVGLRAPNRAHGLRTYFETFGIRVRDRVGDWPGHELLSLLLSGGGRGYALGTLPASQIHWTARRLPALPKSGYMDSRRRSTSRPARRQ